MDSNRWNFLFLVKPCSSAESTLTYYKWGWPPGWLYYIRPNKKIYWFSSNANEPKADKLEVSRKMILPLTRHASILCLGSSWSQEVMSSNPGTGFFTLVCSENCIVLEKTKLNYTTIERLLDKNVHVRSKNRLCGSLLASRQSNKTDTKLIFHVLIQLVFLHTNQTFSVLSYDLGGCLSLVDVFGPIIVLLPRRRILTEYIITCSFLEKITVSLCQWLVTEGIQRKETKKERGRGWLAQI